MEHTVPEASRPSPRLPLELIGAVLENLTSQPNDLASAALVSKGFQTEAERALYQCVLLKTSRRTVLFCDAVLSSARRAQCVRCINCYTPDADVIPELYNTLQTLVNVTWLCLHPRLSMLELSARCSFPSLLELYGSLEDISGYMEFLQNHPSIQVLNLPFSVHLEPSIERSMLPLLAKVRGGATAIKRLVPNRPVSEIELEGYTIGTEAAEVLGACAQSSTAVKKFNWKGWAMEKELIQQMASALPHLTSLTIENLSSTANMAQPADWVEAIVEFKDLKELTLTLLGSFSSPELPFEDQARLFCTGIAEKCQSLERLTFHDRMWVRNAAGEVGEEDNGKVWTQFLIRHCTRFE